MLEMLLSALMFLCAAIAISRFARSTRSKRGENAGRTAEIKTLPRKPAVAREEDQDIGHIEPALKAQR